MIDAWSAMPPYEFYVSAVVVTLAMIVFASLMNGLGRR